MWQCPKCNEQLEDQFFACWKCGTAQDGSTLVSEQQFKAVESGGPVDEELAEVYEDIQSKFPAHTVLADLSKMMAWLLALLGLAGAGYGFWLSSPIGSFAILVVVKSLLGGAIGCLLFLAIAEALRMLGSIEENTRLTATLFLSCGNGIDQPCMRECNPVSQTAHADETHGASSRSSGPDVQIPGRRGN